VKVTEVDANLLRFRNLEELTLTGNYIRRVTSQHLPRTLKVCLHLHSLAAKSLRRNSWTISALETM